MKRFFLSLFSSPESLLQVMSQQEIIEAVEDGDRIIIDQDGNASVNYKSNEVRQDFLRHVNALKRARYGNGDIYGADGLRVLVHQPRPVDPL